MDSPDTSPLLTRRNFLKVGAAGTVMVVVPGLNNPEQTSIPEIEGNLKELQTQINYVNDDLNLKFEVPYYQTQGHFVEKGENFILDLAHMTNETPVEYLSSLPWAEEPIPLEVLQKEAFEHVESIRITATASELTPNAQVEREYLTQIAETFPRLALGFPHEVDFVESSMIRGERAEADRLTLINPTTVDRTQLATLSVTLHEGNHYFLSPLAWERLSPYFTLEEFAQLQAAQLQMTSEIFTEIMNIDTEADPEAVDVYFSTGYTTPTLNNISDLLPETTVQDIYTKLEIKGDPSQIKEEVVLVRVLQNLKQTYSEQPPQMQDTYQALAGRLYYDIFHSFVDFAPTNEYFDPFALNDPIILSESYLQQLPDHPFLARHAKLAELRMQILASQEVHDYNEIVDFLEEEASQIPVFNSHGEANG